MDDFPEEALSEKPQLSTDDVHYIVSMMDSIASKLSEALPVAGATGSLSIQAVDLDALAQSMFGITDPIGQLSSWLAEQLRSIASWIGDVVRRIVSDLWSSFISPALSALSRAVGDIGSAIRGIGDAISGLGSAVAGIPGAVASSLRGFFDSLSSAISSGIASLSSAIASGISSIQSGLAAVSKALSGVADTVSRGLSSIADTVARIPSLIQQLVASLSQTIQSGVQQLSGAVGQLGATLSAGLSSLQSMVTSMFQQLTSTVLQSIQSLVQTLTESLRGMAAAMQAGFSELGRSLTLVTQAFTEYFGRLGESMARGFASASEALAGLGRAIAQLPGLFTEGLGALARSFTDALSGLSRAFQSGLDFVGKTLTGFAQQVGDWFSGVFRTLQTGFGELGNLIRAAVSAISEAMRPILDSVVSGFMELGKMLSSVGENLKQVGVVIMGFVNSILQLPGLLQNAFSGFFEGIINGIRALVEGIISFLKDPLGALRAAIDWLAGQIWKLLPDWLKSVLESAGKFFQGLWEGIQAFIKDPWGSIARAFQELGRWIWERLPDWAKNAINAITGFFQWLWDQLKGAWNAFVNAVQEFVKWLWERLPEPIRNFFQWLADLFAKAGQVLWDFFTKHLPGFFSWLWEQIQAFIKDPAGFLYNNVLMPIWRGLQWLWDEIYKRLPDWLKNAIDMLVKFFTEQLPAFFKWLWEGFQKFIKDPIGFINEYVIKPLVDWIRKGLQWLWEQVGNFLTTLTGMMGSIGSALINAASNLSLALSGVVVGTVVGALSAVTGVAQSVYDSVNKAFMEIGNRIAGETSKWYVEQYSQILGSLGISTPEYLTMPSVEGELGAIWRNAILLFFGPLGFRFLGNVVGWGFKKLGSIASHFTPKPRARTGGRGGVSARGRATGRTSVGAPAGAGVGGSAGAGGGTDVSVGADVSFTFDFGKALGGSLWTFGEELSNYATELGRAMYYGLGIWLGRVFCAPFVYHARNVAPLYTPPDMFWREVMQRFLPHKQSTEIERIARFYLGLQGWSDFFVDLITMEADKLYITVKDRFGKERKVPLALKYTLPSQYDAAAMMVRDVFAGVSEYVKLAKMVGIHDDVAAFYALLRYRYPVPSDLAKFYWRGVAGMLWSPGIEPDPAILADLQATLGVGFKPAPPRELNMKTELLNRMVATYLKWQDYFPLAWSQGFPADVSIYHELTADLPTKIDARWMMKWAILEQISTLVDTMTADLSSIISAVTRATGRELYSAKVTKGITMDVTLLARLVEATGMHPYWVPLIAVAEGINAVADEKTMIRSAVVTAYKEGLISLDNTEALLSGAMVQDVITGYVDPATGKPVKFTYKLPVAWLPIERRLMQIKAVVDRVVDIYRDLTSAIARAVRMRVYTPAKATEALKNVIALAQKHLLGELGRVTDIAAALEVDESYLRFYSEAQALVSEIDINIFLRTMAQRLLGWILYRVSYGYVRVEDFDELLQALVKGFFLTEAEANAVRGLFGVLYRIASREMIPTPSQLGTFAEYMVVPSEIIGKVLSEHRVPREYWDLWIRYISVKPVKSDFRALLTAAARAYRRRAIKREEWESLLAEARRFGFTDIEIELLRRRVELETVSEGTEEYIPPLGTLASMVEYIEVSPDLVAAALQARGVTEPWATLWTQYIMTRTISSEVNALVSTFRRVFEYFTVPEDFLRRMMELMRAGGWTSRELQIFQLDLELRKAYRIMSALVPTLRQFISDAQYIGDWERLFNDLLRARGVEVEKYKEQVEYYKRLIKSRKIGRRISWYITRVMNAASYGVITLDEAKRRLEKLKPYGLDDDEISLIMDGIQLQLAYQVARRGR